MTHTTDRTERRPKPKESRDPAVKMKEALEVHLRDNSPQWRRSYFRWKKTLVAVGLAVLALLIGITGVFG